MKTKYIVIRTRHYEVIRFFEEQNHGAKPVKVYYEDGLWAMRFHIKARTKYNGERPSLCRSSYCKIGADLTLAPLFFIFLKLKEELIMEYTREGRAVTYIHYGHEEFDTRRFKGITNFGNVGVKPSGGLWASPVEAKSSWKEWCECEDFRDCCEYDSFRFTMRNPDKIFYIDSEESFKEFAGRRRLSRR